VGWKDRICFLKTDAYGQSEVRYEKTYKVGFALIAKSPLMKSILVPVILFVCVQLHAQSDTSKVQFMETSDSTSFGTPDGKLISSEIGTAGGKIVSDDGRVELIFPAGSLIGTTVISIQATTNLLDSAAGNAYRFEPSGIQFNIPVQILFHYSDEENEICPAELMQFAMQDHSGKWTYIEYDDWDSTSKNFKR
jgi:hypothetical protein